MRNAAVILIIVTLALALLASRWGNSTVPAAAADELARLRYAVRHAFHALVLVASLLSVGRFARRRIRC